MQAALTAIYRYPVKSMGGHTMPETLLTENGMPGDRCWTVKDEERGGIKGGKRFPELMSMYAELLAEPDETNPSPPVQITLPDGTTVQADDTSINDKLSGAVNSPVSLWPLLPKDQLDHYLRDPMPEGVDQEAALREVFARTPDEPMPDISTFPPEVFIYETPPGTYFDAFPLLIMSTSALQRMAEVNDSNFDVRRFRPNLLVETDQPGFPENDWVGRTVRLGGATLKVEMQCPRCIMTTHGFNDLPRDPKVMRALVQANNGDLGVYASVLTPGKVSVGDKLIID